MTSFNFRVKTVFEDQLIRQTSANTVKYSWLYPRRPPQSDTGRYAVLCCLRETENGEVFVLITTRSDTVSIHPGTTVIIIRLYMLHLSLLKGQPCFPGGKEELYDHCLEDTALREAEEEINLKREDVEIVTVLPPFVFPTAKNILVQCHVVVCTLITNVNDLTLVSNDEVKSIYWIPLRLFLGGCKHWSSRLPYDQDQWNVDFFKVIQSTNKERAVVVWGLTARVCILVASIVYSQPPHVPFTAIYMDCSKMNKIQFQSFLLPDINTSMGRSKL